MKSESSIEARAARVAAAVRADGFEAAAGPGGYVVKDGMLGMAARHSSARSSRTGAPKRAYYVEGMGRQAGWLLGVMAEPEVARMAGEFVENVPFAFFGSRLASDKGALSLVKDVIVEIVAGASARMLPDIPAELVAEIDGLEEGCRAANPRTTVRRERLLALNLGFDALLAHIYTGTIFAERGVHPRLLRAPIGCNAFSISGDAASGRHFFGRDFMFPTADVFQDVAGLVIHVPDPAGDGQARAFVSQGAPGMVGVLAAMNADGVAIGVDMLPSRLCDPGRPGLNSLLLIRDCIQHSISAQEAVRRIREAPRGVSWLYPVADAGGDAFVVEAGRRLPDHEPFPFFEHVPGYYRKRLPDAAYMARLRERYGIPGPENGLVVRGRDYRLPDEYLQDWNPGLWRAFDRNWLEILKGLASDVVGEVKGLFSRRLGALWRQWLDEIARLGARAVFDDAMFRETGFIDSTWTDRNCPGPFYFAPQRERRADVLIATNHAISPEMRLTSMNEWIAFLAGPDQDEMQWRYDEINHEIHDALARGPIDEKAAWDIVDFLRPDGRFPRFYNHGNPSDWRTVQVHGSVTLCELTTRTFTSRFGYYGDAPVTIHLARFVPQ